MAVYICVYASLSMSRNTAYETAAYSQKHLPTYPFLAECFCILRSLSDFLFTHEVFSFLFQSSFDVFPSAATETGDPIDTSHDTASSMDAEDANTVPPASLLLAGVVCLHRIVDMDHQQSSALLVLP